MRRLFPENIEKFVLENYKGRYTDQLTELINETFQTNYQVSQVKAWKNKQKLRSGVPKARKNRNGIFPKEIQGYIREHIEGTPMKQLTSMVNDTFQTAYTYEQIASYAGRHHLKNGIESTFQKGHTPANKGVKGVRYAGCAKSWFKKGNMPQQYRPVGSERVNVDGYTEVKVADPRTWQLKQRIVWEAHYGKIPKGSAILFLDGNKQNFDIDNLTCVTRAELRILNQKGLLYDNAETTKAGIMIARVLAAKYKKAKKDKDRL